METCVVAIKTVLFCFSLPFYIYSIVQINRTEIKYLRSFQQKKFRKAESKFLLEGWRPLRDVLESNYIVELIATLPEISKRPENANVLATAKNRKIPIKELKEIQLRQLSDTKNSQGVVALVHIKKPALDLKFLQSANIIVACDGISDPGNLGTIIRTCDWFGVDAVLLNRDCVSLYNEKVIRSTAGSIFHLNVFEDIDFGDVISELKLNGFKFIVTALDGEPLDSYIPSGRNIIVLGSEAQGVSKNLIRTADDVIGIPRYGHAESLNVGIACGIFLSHWRRHIAK